MNNGDVQPRVKSEKAPPPLAQLGTPVKKVVAETLGKQLFIKDEDVLLEVYASWCGHCQAFEPEYEKLGEKVVQEGFENILTIAKMDGTANGHPQIVTIGIMKTVKTFFFAFPALN